MARTIADVAGLALPGGLLSGVDSALRRGLLDLGRLEALVGSRAHRGSAAILRKLIAIADGRSESPLESWLRLVLIEAGLGPVELQIPVRAAGVSYRIDLGYPRVRVGIEARGRAFHGSADAVLKDRRRHNAIQGQGWELLYFSWEDVVDQPWQAMADIRRALAERSGRAS